MSSFSSYILLQLYNVSITLNFHHHNNNKLIYNYLQIMFYMYVHIAVCIVFVLYYSSFTLWLWFYILIFQRVTFNLSLFICSSVLTIDVSKPHHSDLQGENAHYLLLTTLPLFLLVGTYFSWQSFWNIFWLYQMFFNLTWFNTPLCYLLVCQQVAYR